MPRIRAALIATALVGALFATLTPAASAGTDRCPGSPVEVRGRVTDAATGLPLDEVTSIGVYQAPDTVGEGIGTNQFSRFSTCVPPGNYTFSFAADSYRHEWYNNATTQAAATNVVVAGTDPVVVNIALTPRGRVLAGRITNRRGVPKFASIGIWRRTSRGWRSIDGIGNDPATGKWSFRVPRLGRYRVAAFVDHHEARWATSETRLRHARTLIVTESTIFINDVNVRVPYCPGPTADFCIPPGFNS